MEYKKIRDFAEIISGSTPKTSNEEFWNGDLKWITPAEIGENTVYVCDTDRKLTELGAKSCSLSILPKNTVLLTSRAPIGKVALVGEAMYCNQGFKNIKCDEKIISPKYLFYWLKNNKTYLNSLGRGATFKEISKKIVEDIEVPVINRESQDKLVTILDKSQSLIDKRKEQIEALDELVKSRFIEMFGDPVKNPKGWEEDTIGDVTKSIIAGWSVNGESRVRREDEIAVLKVSAVTKGFFKEDEYKVIDKDIEIKKYVFPQKGDLLFSRANTREMVGATCIIKNDYPNLILPDKLWKVLFTERVNVFYMKYVLSEQSIRKQFSSKSTGTSGSMYNVSMDKFKEIQITIPPIELQNEFADLVTQVDKLKADMEKSLKEMEDNFNSLMQKAFKGELF